MMSEKEEKIIRLTPIGRMTLDVARSLAKPNGGKDKPRAKRSRKSKGGKMGSQPED